MTRSRRKHPIVGMTTARSEKQDKRIANRRQRAATRTALTTDHDPDATAMPVPKETSDPWNFDKDGKHYLSRKWRTRKALGK